MKRFHFSLQAVHNLREMRRDAAERELAALVAEHHEAQVQLQAGLRRREAAMENYLVLHHSAEIQAVTFATHTNYIDSLFQLERQSRATILQLEERIATKRVDLTEASRQTETTANLRDRQRARHYQEGARLEQNLLDEMAVAGAARRLAANGH
jgi:flagellar export protein FliJ